MSTPHGVPEIRLVLRLEAAPAFTLEASDDTALARLADWMLTERFGENLRTLVEAVACFNDVSPTSHRAAIALAETSAVAAGVFPRPPFGLPPTSGHDSAAATARCGPSVRSGQAPCSSGVPGDEAGTFRDP